MRMTIDGINLPVRKTIESAGYDISCPEDVTLYQGIWTRLDLGIQMEKGDIPYGFVGLILPRSSTGMKHGLRMKNTVGVIDSDYTMDTIKATLTIDSPEGKVSYKKNDRILQMIIVPMAVIPSEELPIQERTGGVGSTGA